MYYMGKTNNTAAASIKKSRTSLRQTGTNDSNIPLALYIVLALSVGLFGVHDFVTKRHWQGLLHILLSVTAGFLPIIISSLAPTSSDFYSFSNMALNMVPILYAGNFIWVVCEIIAYANRATGSYKETSTKSDSRRSLAAQKNFKTVSIIAAVLSIIIILAETAAIISTVRFLGACDGSPSRCTLDVGIVFGITVLFGSVPAIANVILSICSVVMYRNLPKPSKSDKNIITIRNFAFITFGIALALFVVYAVLIATV